LSVTGGFAFNNVFGRFVLKHISVFLGFLIKKYRVAMLSVDSNVLRVIYK